MCQHPLLLHENLHQDTMCLSAGVLSCMATCLAAGNLMGSTVTGTDHPSSSSVLTRVPFPVKNVSKALREDLLKQQTETSDTTTMTAYQKICKPKQIIIRQYYYTGLRIYFVKESILFGIKVKCLITFEITHMILVILQQQYPFCITAFS